MQEAAQRLVGRHDFTTFRHIDCQSKLPIKTLDVLDVRRIKEDIHITASARSFLHTQVRSMVGALALAFMYPLLRDTYGVIGDNAQLLSPTSQRWVGFAKLVSQLDRALQLGYRSLERADHDERIGEHKLL